MYKQLPPGSYPKTLCVSPLWDFAELIKLFGHYQFQYPIVVKPDVGKMGLMFRKIANIYELKRYHETMPVNYILQEFIAYPIEVSVFYFRFPGAPRGKITGFIKKEYLNVTGDGESTLEQLITVCPMVRFRQEEMKLKHKDKLNYVIRKGEQFCLSYALNLSRGSRLVSLAHENDERLLQVFDDLSKYSRGFFYGRYDIKCASVEDLKQGKNFSILEFNGSGGEPHHVYAQEHNLLKASKELLGHWRILFEISKANHLNGIRYWNFVQGWKFLMAARKHNKMLERLDRQFPVG